MLPESQSAVIARNETWQGSAATEPYEAGWAHEAVFFVRALKASGRAGSAAVEVSPDGMHWAEEGTRFPLPSRADEVTFARVREFGNWIRLAASLPDGASLTVLVTVHVKA
jgi:hypothetical protein